MAREGERRYARPASGADDWGSALNETFGAVETDVRALADRIEALEAGGDDGADGDTVPGLLHSAAGVPVAEPGDLAGAVADLPTGGDPRPVQYSLLKLAEGETYRPTEPVTLDDGQQVHAYGARIEPRHDGPVFRCRREARVYGGTVDLGARGGSAFEFVGERMGFPKGPQGTSVVAEPGSGATGVRVYSEAIRSGRGGVRLTTDGVDHPVDVRIEAGGDVVFLNSTPVFLRASDYRVALRLRGTDATNANRFVLDLEPSDRSEAAILVDHTDFSENLFEGRIRTPERHDSVVRIERSSLAEYERPKNTVATYDGTTFDASPAWVDRTADRSDRHDESRNRMIDFSEAAFDYRGDDLGIGEGGVLVADGSNLQATLEAAADEGANVRIESGTDLQAAGVTIPEGVAVDARGARIRVTTRYADRAGGITFEPGALLVGGRVFARMNGDEAALTVRADGETVDRPTGPVETVLQCKRECTGLLVEAVDGGRITGLNNSVETIAPGRAYRIRADGDSGIVGNRLSLGAVNAIEYNLKTHGQGEVADNHLHVHLHSNDGEMDANWIVDGPRVRGNTADGWFWDTGRWGVATTEVRESGGDNLYLNLFNAEYPAALDRTRPPMENRRKEKYRGDLPVNEAGSNYREIGYNTLDEEPALRARAAADRLTQPSFSPLPFEADR